MPGAAVPETSVHEYGQLGFWKNKIRLAENRTMATPAGDVIRSKNFRQRDFRGLVAASANLRHHHSALGFGENVSHATVHHVGRQGQNAARFHPVRACASGRRGRTIEHRSNIIPRRQSVSKRAASHFQNKFVWAKTFLACVST